MLFNSVEFLLFLPCVFVLYWFVFNRYLHLQNSLLLIASYFFYGWWSWKFMLLLLGSTILDYAYGFGVASSDHRKSRFFLWMSVLNNVGILAIFKYYNFFITQIEESFSLLGVHFSPTLLQIGLPVGISFYTFHGMSYVFDIYRKQLNPVKSFVDYALFVSFFPLLVAGPIERAHHLLPQVQKRREFNYTQAIAGCRLIVWGLFKKIVIADSLSKTVDYVFANFRILEANSLLIGAVAFSFQIYADFSGYSDIALGTANLFGFELLSNFKFPYFSRNLAEFWRRWHISLSSWFRDYLYIPLGGSRNGLIVSIRNTLVIFIVSGFWHGASWTFIIWGFIHACGFLPLLIANRNKAFVSEPVAAFRFMPSFRELLQMIKTFLFVTFAWVFFRSEKLVEAFQFIARIVKSYWTNPSMLISLPAEKMVFIYIFPFLLIEWYLRGNERQLNFPKNPLIRRFIYVILIAFIYISYGMNNNFIYFQF